MSNDSCERCKRTVERHEGGVNLGSIEEGYEFLCTPCFNDKMAQRAGVEFENPRFEPVVLEDASGCPHEFHFAMRFLVDRIAIDAYEVRGGDRLGYEFQQVELDAHVDPLAMLGRLIEKMKRALARRHVVPGSHGDRICDEGTVRGRIEWDADLDGIPMLNIDGRDVTWEEFGRMMMSYEGWQFRLEIKDPSDEV